MNKCDMTIERMLDLKYTDHKALFRGLLYPWEALPLIHGYIESIGEGLLNDGYEEISPKVWVHKTARLMKSAYIGEYTVIGPETEVRHCAFIRGNVISGRGCVIGNSCELKNSLLFDMVQVPHYNYIGDSILGYKSHMGAASLTSNFRQDKGKIIVHADDGDIDTDLRKMGAILSSFVEVGCGSVLNPGTVIGENANIYPLSSVRGNVGSFKIFKNPGNIADKLKQ